MIKSHKCKFIRVGAGIPFVWNDMQKMAEYRGEPIAQIVRDSILRECEKPCEDASEKNHILFCPGCNGVKKIE